MLSLFAVTARAAENENSIPGGWDLSATLAVLRNLPMMESATFPASQGDVYFARSEDSKVNGRERSFTNTYKYYRATNDGKYMEIMVVEEHTTGELTDGTRFYRVADLSQALTVVETLPESAVLLNEMSKLLGFILDHRQTLLASKAGEFARQLNNGKEGRLRPDDYTIPKVTYSENQDGKVDKVWIHGLVALLNKTAGATQITEDQVLEISVNQSSTAEVSLINR